MREVVIEDPVINSPFGEPERHFRFDEVGITSEIVPGRRVSSYFMPIPKAKKKGKAAKVATARTIWIPAVNNHGGFGRWAFLEVSDPCDARNTIRSILRRTPELVEALTP